MDNSTQHTPEDWILRYIDGEMSDEEGREFEARLLTDASLREQTENLKMAREAILQFGLKQQVASLHQTIMAEKETPVVNLPAKRPLRWVMSVAATILLAWVSFEVYQYFSLTPDKVFAQQFAHYELPVLRSDDQKKVSELETAYRDKDYNQVVRLCKTNTGFSSRESFLCGMAEMELGNYADAIRSFHQIQQYNASNNTHEYQEETEYNLALAYLKNKEFARSLELFQAIRADNRHLYHQKVSAKLVRQVKRFS